MQPVGLAAAPQTRSRSSNGFTVLTATRYTRTRFETAVSSRRSARSPAPQPLLEVDTADDSVTSGTEKLGCVPSPVRSNHETDR